MCLVHAIADDDVLARIATLVPETKLPEEVASTVLWLSSDAGSEMTGGMLLMVGEAKWS
jgi:hypothetical protein